MFTFSSHLNDRLSLQQCSTTCAQGHISDIVHDVICPVEARSSKQKAVEAATTIVQHHLAIGHTSMAVSSPYDRYDRTT